MSRTVSHYLIEGEIGRGGMGVVYRAVDTRLGRGVAIKMLTAEATADADRIRRFVQEARSASALNHPHIVTIYDIDEADGATFIAMELVEGTPLDRMIAEGPVPIDKALEYGAQIASALEAAHASGIVHRDIKPGNIIVTSDGRAKVLDFGLAKLFDRAPTLETMTAMATQPGLVMGTPAYMSPEQAEGQPVDARSDIFSFGAVLYELLTGRRPFAGSSDIGIITSILRDQPPAVGAIRAHVPAAVETIVNRSLEKDPAARYPDARALRNDLTAAHARLTRPAEAVWRRPAVVISIVLLLVAATAYGVWKAVEGRRATWVVQQAIPEIERLETNQQFVQAVRRARDVERYAPAEIARVRQGWYPVDFATLPENVDVDIKNYLDVNGAWERLGRTPLREHALPFGSYRVRMSKAGFVPVEISSPAMGRRVPIKLAAEGTAPAGMVAVTGGDFGVGVAQPVALEDFWLDKYEVSNREFKRFVDAGGYRDSKYWKEPFRRGDRVLGFDEAMARFRDATGRPAPATWELGSYPEGQEDLPVGGISWFEAAAFAAFSGKSLPTLYHWYRAVNMNELSSDILRLSNFDGKGPRKVGEAGGVGPWGTLDMAGNVKEWCANEVRGKAELRYIPGGAWDEPSYRYTEADAQNPWDRLKTYGVRLAKIVDAGSAAAGPIAHVYGDPKSLVPVSDADFNAYRRFYDYDRTPLNARVDSVDDSPPYWRKETVSFDAAYGGERVPALLFLPRNATPPYQTVVLFPSGYAMIAQSNHHLDYSRFEFIIRSGRALIYPIYQGTFERRNSLTGVNARRDMQVQWAKDLFRAVDYLETRSDVDMQRLGYYSLSMGAYFGPIPVALEPRIKVAVLASGGLRFNYQPEIQPMNFAPHVKVPVLLVNGRNDFQSPLESQRRVMELLGTPPEHKQHVVLDGGHVPSDHSGMVRVILEWFDKYLGPLR